MPEKSSCTSPKKQLLGEIETRITGMQYYETAVAPGEQLNLEREHDNTHDEQAILVENGLFEPVGHIPRQLCSWLAPLTSPTSDRHKSGAACLIRNKEPPHSSCAAMTFEITAACLATTPAPGLRFNHHKRIPSPAKQPGSCDCHSD